MVVKVSHAAHRTLRRPSPVAGRTPARARSSCAASIRAGTPKISRKRRLNERIRPIGSTTRIPSGDNSCSAARMAAVDCQFAPGPDLRGDVAHDRSMRRRSPRERSHRRDRQRNVEDASVLGDALRLEMLNGFAGAKPFEDLIFLAEAFRRNDARDRAARSSPPRGSRAAASLPRSSS